jgi:hypothetical protein
VFVYLFLVLIFEFYHFWKLKWCWIVWTCTQLCHASFKLVWNAQYLSNCHEILYVDS